ncbi:glycine cleavage system transcriptional repressor [Zobellella endophytica]|uniref:Glycine cleavage system transcriptional repressor n=1 Tax=Zobellella endophytica TaxID=2116700 RepID=A0A2P7R6H6_9GAMM|nr:ACT domain-containing protein [Zobellella endophytica]PSJ45818.1 glycine cleavage system transcriptional repressor [Zobellella endophytica]
MTHHLVVTAIGENRAGIVNEVARHVTDCGCNIVDSRLGIFGNEFTFILLLSGSWNQITRLETTLPLFGQSQALITMMKRTQVLVQPSYALSADVDMVLTDRPGIVNRCTQFFSDQGWDIQAMQSQTLTGDESGLFQAHFQLNLPEQLADDAAQATFGRLCHELECERHRFRLKRK